MWNDQRSKTGIGDYGSPPARGRHERALRARRHATPNLRNLVLATLCVFCMCARSNAKAQPVEEFYKGRVVNLIVGFNPGGAYDPYARAVARHLPNHLPGSPAIVVKNMQGAGSVLAANHLYNVSPKDGSELGLIAGSAALDPMFNSRKTQYNGQKFTWLGSANEEISGCFAWHTAGFTKAEDLFTKQLLIGASGTSNLDFPMAMNAVLGTRMKLVRGYNGTSSIMLAIERGEVQGMCGMVYAPVKAAHPDWFTEHKIRMLMQIGLEPNEKLKGIPFGMDYAKSEDDKRVLRLIVGWTIMGRPFLAPPGIPDDRKAALRKAFDETMRDPAFLADAERARLDISPISGEKIDSFLADAYATPKPLVERAAKILSSAK
jgi:tripartite-type tricarboxylate transporter receptor subunit TctC